MCGFLSARTHTMPNYAKLRFAEKDSSYMHRENQRRQRASSCKLITPNPSSIQNAGPNTSSYKIHCRHGTGTLAGKGAEAFAVAASFGKYTANSKAICHKLIQIGRLPNAEVCSTMSVESLYKSTHMGVLSAKHGRN